MAHDHLRDVFTKLGEEWQFTDGVIKDLEEFMSRLYVIYPEICDNNEMCYELFRMKDDYV